MRSPRWIRTNRWTPADAVAALLALSLVGCGGGGGNDGGDEPMGPGPSPNQAPAATIDGPQDEDNFDEGETVTFEATTTDPEDGDLTGSSVAWSSDVDGDLGTGTTLDASGMSVGHHLVTVTATDSEGATATDEIGVRIRPQGQAVTVDLSIGDNFFEDLQGRQNGEAFVKIRLGDGVTWTNDGGVGHTVTSGEGSGGNDGDGVPQGGTPMSSGTITSGGTFTYQPDAVGTWTYYCEVHPGVMIEATIEVVPAP